MLRSIILKMSPNLRKKSAVVFVHKFWDIHFAKKSRNSRNLLSLTMEFTADKLGAHRFNSDLKGFNVHYVYYVSFHI